MELTKAKIIAAECIEKLRPFCQTIAVAGSIRRNRPLVHDIDIVLIPANQGMVAYTLSQLGKIKVGGGKIIRVGMGFTKGIDLDIYVATPETWATLLLIRTGSKESNFRLCMRARSMGMTLKADGSGLFRLARNQTEYENAPDIRIAGDSEESIFAALDLPYLDPEQRN